MESGKVFLTAEWRNLVMLSYAVEPALLEPFVPAGTELDRFQGRTYLSLIGFEFNRSRLFGIRVPLHQAFEEVNLRFYVNRQGRRGVVFLRELVPKRAVAVLARLAYRENYSCVPMAHHAVIGDTGKVDYSWHLGERCCRIEIETEGPGFLPAEGSEEQFISEHYWGYAGRPGGGCLEYEVFHPPWRVWKARRATFTGDASALYGEHFARVLARPPDSAFLAEGSAVVVYRGTRIV
jgi:uncharacterized protein